MLTVIPQFTFLNNGSDTGQLMTEPFEFIVSNSLVPSPPSARGTVIMESEGSSFSNPVRMASQTPFAESDPLNLSGAIRIVTRQCTVGWKLKELLTPGPA